MQLKDFSLDHRYTLTHGGLFLSGTQALVRLTIEQSRNDRARGLNTAGYVSGYPGSPLAGLDKEFLANRALTDAHHVKFHPAINEELAATAISGSQQIGLYPGAEVDGVFGMWYGKAPGLDRAGDALRHANQAGTSPNGGMLVVAGDDHNAKSSSIASYSNSTFCDLDIPVLVPASVVDVIDFGLYGWALSRYSGLLVGLLTCADNMDSAMTVVRPQAPPDFSMQERNFDVHIRKNDRFFPKDVRIAEEKFPAMRGFIEQHPIDRIFGQSDAARTGIIAYGRAYSLLREALARLGFRDESDLDAAGLRLLKVGMVWPLDAKTLSRFAEGIERILVVEEGRPFLEHSVKSALYGQSSARITAKFDESGVRQFRDYGEFTNTHVFQAVARFLGRHTASPADQPDMTQLASTGRLPLYCAGCPHNQSTRVPEGSRILAGIGCHSMAIWLDRDTDHYCQMGGEGAMWMGQAPFTKENHVFANLGDGTYRHSGILAVRAAVASGVNITYNLLYNHVVAMTGGQPVEDELSINSIVRGLEAEGVKKIIVVSNDPQRTRTQGYDGLVRHRDELRATQTELRDTEGCTVLLYDQSCATELRRKRKRGLAEAPTSRAFINQDVCEGCGDCSAQSSCVAIEPVETELGSKSHIHQSNCNIDLTCVRGFCPSFVMVEGAELRKQAKSELSLEALIAETPTPTIRDADDADFECNIALAGVGGAGTSTISAILGVAGHIDGLTVKTFDLTGLAQKGGAVTAHVRLSRRTYSESSAQIPEGGADVLIGVDLITATSINMLTLASAERTHAFINTNIENTIEFVLGRQTPGSGKRMKSALDKTCRSVRRVAATKLTATFLGDAQMTNMLMLGFAWQSGEIPIRREALHRAIELNGVRVKDNIAAFEYGRVANFDGQKLLPELSEMDTVKTFEERMRFLRDSLTAYQDAAYADRHQGMVERVRSATSHLCAEDREALMRAVADSYHKLLTYKDEFEVARLYSKADFRASLDKEFSSYAKLKVMMAPPFLPGTDSSTGRPKKRVFGPWVFPLFKMLAKLKWLRKTPFNPFARTADRRLERELISEYESTVDTICAEVQPECVELALAIARLPEEVRGFGPVKRASAQRYREQRTALLKRFLDGENDAPGDAVIHREAA
ncbi:MAG: indolepyruvate ferredoxin oxidoreductase family protein [Gammaproteobacteria bacterium]|nr:indolepyruvate ferredoxin oxidoreductase family protein [Gammaproteobacteria bacterium]